MRATATSFNGVGLGIYRITFGLLLCCSSIRFLLKGWVYDCYLAPNMHFSYRYFEWVKPFSPDWLMYLLVVLCALASFLVAIGLFYRIAIVCSFFLFTYLELIEKAWYLNHYYFVSIILLLLCFIPADHRLSLKSYFSKSKARALTPPIYANVLRLQISLVYFFAGLAKFTSDWLWHALPLKIWLKAKVDVPLIGWLFELEAIAYLFSYFGLAYDLGIAFLLWNKKTRPLALLLVVAFHVMTAVLFNIGMFPWIMIVGSLIFVQDDEWEKLFAFFQIKLPAPTFSKVSKTLPKWLLVLFGLHFFVQLLLPLRPYLYNKNKLWTERYYRFAWNVMLMEKAGYAIFTIKEPQSGKTWKVYPNDHLSPTQEKQMNFQADMIWQFAQYLQPIYQKKAAHPIEIYVDAFVTLNGRPSKRYLPQDLNLLQIKQEETYDFILPLDYTDD